MVMPYRQILTVDEREALFDDYAEELVEHFDYLYSKFVKDARDGLSASTYNFKLSWQDADVQETLRSVINAFADTLADDIVG